jgi:hypothetical protein
MSPDLKKILGPLVGTIAFVSAVASIWVLPLPMRVLSGVCIFVALLAVGGYGLCSRWFKRDPIPTVKPAGCAVTPAGQEDIRWIAQLEAEFYSEEDAIPEHVLQGWYGVNPDGFFIIRGKNGERVGHLDILPIRPRTLNGFLDGQILERDIPGDGLYTPKQKEQVQHLYIESLILLPQKEISASALRCVLSHLPQIIGAVCNPGKLQQVYAMPVSKRGKRLAESLGFQVRCHHESRKDHHDVFVSEFADVLAHAAQWCDEGIRRSRVRGARVGLKRRAQS